MIRGTLYIICLSTPLLKFLDREEATSVLVEVHEDIVSQYLGARALAKEVLRVGYYWPSMVLDAKEYTKKDILSRFGIPQAIMIDIGT